MKKIMGILMATVMVVTLAGCSSNEHDYLKEAEATRSRANNVVDQSFYTNDVRSAAQGYLAVLMEWSNAAESVDNPDEIIRITRQTIEKGNEYLAKIERLNPPDDEKLFHRELLEWVDIGRELQNDLSDFCESISDEDEKKLNAVSSKFDSHVDKFDSKLQELANSKDWFKRAVEDYL
ncbi:MAG: YgdI/YgdR family lipoprotein [Oscillospiraceae bacterium]|nr:YgdI/YgdR family lipoprotein [Oscillospiraceae bacterium]